MRNSSLVVAVYETHLQADIAIRQLHASGFDMTALSVIGKDYHTAEHPIAFYNAGDRMKLWGKSGAFWGGLFGLLLNPALFLIPGIGHLIALGPIVATIISAGEGVVVGGSAGLFVGALSNLGIPEDSVVRYERQIKAGKFLVIAQGTPELLEKARATLHDGAAEAVLHRG